MDLQLSGQVALVTCASAGVGRACVESLLREGADVIAVSRGLTPADFLDEPRAGKLKLVQADLANGPEFEAALSSLPMQPSILVFVPVREPTLGFQEVTSDLMLGSVDRTLTRLLFLAGKLLPSMRANRFGRIVTVLGASTLAPLSDHVLANVSRVAVASVVAGIAHEFAAENVCANNILLGPFDTPGLKALWEARANSMGIALAEITDRRLTRVPSRRLGRPDECGRLCAMLCSPALGFLTGQSILMDGGANFNL